MNRHVLSRVICWVAIVAAIGSVAIRVQLAGRRATDAAPGEVDNSALHTAARMAVGWQALQDTLGQKSPQDLRRSQTAIDADAKSPREKICAAIVAGELLGHQEALSRLIRISPHGDGEIDEDLNTLTQLYADGAKSLDAQQRKRLVARYGWYGQLALVSDLPAGESEHQSAVSSARAELVVLILLGVCFFALALVGLVLLCVAAALLMGGRMTSMLRAIAPPSQGRPPVFLEAFAIYIVTFVLFGEVLPHLVHVKSLAWYFVTVLILPLAMGWPVMRGMSWGDVRGGFGYRAPRGIFREPFMGIVGYIAGLPVVIAGFFISIRLSKLAGASPTHPIINDLRGTPAQIAILYLLACAWAPLMEETMFRGALLNHLRGRFSWLSSSMIVGVLFAMVHPQGWTFIPALGSIGMVLCWIREWRGSILGSMTAHALNNGAVLTLALMLLR